MSVVVSNTPAAVASSSRTRSQHLRLLGRFELVADGAPIPVPLSAQRVAAFVALHARPLERAYVAGTLWLDSPEERAHANLRSALWRLGRHGCRLMDTRGKLLAIRTEVLVDVRELEASIRQALGGSGRDIDPELLADDLLPNWYDDWVMLERERFRQLRLHALEVLCERLTREGQLGDALQAGLAAVAGEPLRESAHRALIRVHLAEGNAAEALRQYQLFRRMLRDHLGVEPSPQIRALVPAAVDASAGRLDA